MNYNDVTNMTLMNVSTAISKLNSYITALSSKQASVKSVMESAKSAYTATTPNGKANSLMVKATTDTPYPTETGEQLYTADANEVETLWKQYRWTFEGVGWYALEERNTALSII